MGRLPPCAGFLEAYVPGPCGKSDYLPIADMRYRMKRHKAFVRRGASWRRMLVSKPGVMVVGRVVGASEDREEWGRGRTGGCLVEFEKGGGGLRMGEFYDAVFDVSWRGRDRWMW